MTYLWQEERGNKFYRVQTDEKGVADIMKRRNKFQLAGSSINSSMWIFRCEFARPDIAKKTVGSITGKKLKIDSEEVFYYA